MLEYKVRGPDPDGAYFIVAIENGEERFLDEMFDSEDAAMEAIRMLPDI